MLTTSVPVAKDTEKFLELVNARRALCSSKASQEGDMKPLHSLIHISQLKIRKECCECMVVGKVFVFIHLHRAHSTEKFVLTPSYPTPKVSVFLSYVTETAFSSLHRLFDCSWLHLLSVTVPHT